MLSPSLTAPPSSSSSSPALLPFSPLPSFRTPTFPLLSTFSTLSTSRKPQFRLHAMIEKEIPAAERPATFLRGIETGASNSPDSVRGRFEKMIREAQDSVCAAIEAADGGAKFKEDVWSRPGGGGGISRVLQDGAVWEKAGVNVSVVYGVMPPEEYRAANPSQNGDIKPGPVPFFAAGISSVLHPKNPFARLCTLITAILRGEGRRGLGRGRRRRR